LANIRLTKARYFTPILLWLTAMAALKPVRGEHSHRVDLAIATAIYETRRDDQPPADRPVFLPDTAKPASPRAGVKEWPHGALPRAAIGAASDLETAQAGALSRFSTSSTPSAFTASNDFAIPLAFCQG